MMRKPIAWLAMLTITLATAPLNAQVALARPKFGTDGIVHVPAFFLPPSELSSEEARAALAARAKAHPAPAGGTDIIAVRRNTEAIVAPSVTTMRQLYAVDVAEQSIAGVRTRVITPRGKPFAPDRVLINLHGGGFSVCADGCALLESIPIAAVGQYKVVTIDYRMGPEAKHPAALEDIEKVYRELLKSHRATRIGVYGCSAGGALTGQFASWLSFRDLPRPGAIGIFGAGALRSGAGDSNWIAAYIDGSFPPPPRPGAPTPDTSRGYFDKADTTDAIISAARHPKALARFPPTLIITGTRSMDLSRAAYTNSQLIKAGVRSSLIVGEGMGHCYIYDSRLPEARDAYQAIVNFFREHLR